MKQIILTVLLPIFVYAKPIAQVAQNKQAPQQSAGLGTDLKTDFRLDDQTVRGKYQSPLEGLVTVENEKDINDLLDYRKNYADRVQRSRWQK